MSLRQPQPVASTLDELLSYHDENFIHVAYHTLLGRAPDSEGLHYYLVRVRAGISRVEILSQIRLSKEGKSKQLCIMGLDKAIKQHQRQKSFLFGPLLRMFGANPVKDITPQQLRRIENTLHWQDAQWMALLLLGQPSGWLNQ